MSSLIRRIQKSAKGGASPLDYYSRGSKLGVHSEVHPRQKKPRGRRRGKYTKKYLEQLAGKSLANGGADAVAA